MWNIHCLSGNGVRSWRMFENLALATFMWTLRSGQYEDLDGAAWRVISESDDKPDA